MYMPPHEIFNKSLDDYDAHIIQTRIWAILQVLYIW